MGVLQLKTKILGIIIFLILIFSFSEIVSSIPNHSINKENLSFDIQNNNQISQIKLFYPIINLNHLLIKSKIIILIHYFSQN